MALLEQLEQSTLPHAKKPRMFTEVFGIWSGKRGSNSRPQPWQGCALPLSYSRFLCNLVDAFYMAFL